VSSYLHGNDLGGSYGKNGMSRVDTRTEMTSRRMLILQHYGLFKCLSSRHHILGSSLTPAERSSEAEN